MYGEGQRQNGRPSTRQANVEPGSDEANPNVGVLSAVPAEGPEAIRVGAISRMECLNASELWRFRP